MLKTPLSTVIGGAFWTPEATVIGGGALNFEKLIAKLFANNEQGFAYDPNDLSTMFQDAAGSVPVTAAGQPVGLMLDKSKGLVLGGEILKPLTNSEWLFSDGITVEGDLLHFTNAIDGAAAICPILAVVSGRYYVLEFDYVSYTSGGGVYARINSGGFTAIPTNTSGHKKVILRAGATGDFIQLAEGAGGGNYTIGNVSLKELAGNHTYQTTSASRPTLRKNAVTGANYLEFDGVDDSLQTSDIDFTGTDKVSLFAGVRKLSDEIQIIAELSDVTNFNQGSFYLIAGSDVDVIGYTSIGVGTLGWSVSRMARNFTYLAPDTAVLSVKHDISSDLSSIRRNGVIGIDGLEDKGTGNFGNYPLFIGRRGGASLPFNGHLYSLIGIARLTTDSETITLEKAIAKNTGVTLNV